MKDRSYTEQELLEGALKNDRFFQEKLYRQYADAMFTIACNYAENEDEAADILQEGFIKIFKNLHSHDKSKSLSAWIRKIIVNTALENYRKKSRHLEVVDQAAWDDSVDEEPDDFMSGISYADIIRCVNELPAKAAMVLKLYSLEGLGHQEISAALNISEGTSKSQLNRARFLLKNRILELKRG